jgi:hypothetical protein
MRLLLMTARVCMYKNSYELLNRKWTWNDIPYRHLILKPFGTYLGVRFDQMEPLLRHLLPLLQDPSENVRHVIELPNPPAPIVTEKLPIPEGNGSYRYTFLNYQPQRDSSSQNPQSSIVSLAQTAVQMTQQVRPPVETNQPPVLRLNLV